jgi:hypothetical protein
MKSNWEPQEKQGTLFHGDELCLIGQVHNPQGPENKSKDETWIDNCCLSINVPYLYLIILWMDMYK